MAKKQDTKVQELEIKVSELDNQLKRAVADYHNLEKRVSEGRSELTKWGTDELVKDMLPSLNNLHKAIAGVQVEAANNNRELPSWFHGVRLSLLELWKVLEQRGLNRFAPNLGSEFDPNVHEPVEVKDGEDNKVLEVVEMGYNLNGKLLQPAKVVVGRKVQDNG